MGSTRQVLTVFIASPGDVAEERKALGAVASRINRISGREWGWQIDLRGWEDTLPGFARPQELINPDVDACDVFIGVVWKRWGQPTGTYSSGFEEEFKRATDRRERSQSPEIMLYFRDIDVATERDPGPQLEKVLAFRQETMAARSLLYKTYGTVAEFEVLLFEHLMKLLGHHALSSSRQAEPAPSLLPYAAEPIPKVSLLNLAGDPCITADRLASRWIQAHKLEPIPMLPSAIGPKGLYKFDLLSLTHSATMLVGATGAGKSEALISIAASAILSLPPDLLRVSFLDLKSWSYVHTLEKIGYVGGSGLDISNDPQGLESLVQEILDREKILVHWQCDTMLDFWTRYPGERHRLPFLLICIDEIQGISFGQADGLNRLIAAAVRRDTRHTLYLRDATTRRYCRDDQGHKYSTNLSEDARSFGEPRCGWCS